MGLLAGVALTDRGQPISSMGTDFRDYDNDGLPDIVFTRARRRNLPALSQRRQRLFRRRTYASHIGPLAPHTAAGALACWTSITTDGKIFSPPIRTLTTAWKTFESHLYKEANSVFVNLAGKFFEAHSPAP